MTISFGAKVTVLSSPKGPMRAFGTLIINDVIYINGFRVLEGSNGLFVAPPQTKGSKPDENGKDQYFDDVRFVEETEEKQRGPVQQAALKAILDAYLATTKTGGGTSNAKSNSTRPEPTGERPPTRVRKW
jgi:DNA-binding cell septation regulator SpoVG